MFGFEKQEYAKTKDDLMIAIATLHKEGNRITYGGIIKKTGLTIRDCEEHATEISAIINLIDAE